MEIVIGIFDSTERAEQAVKDLRQNQIPGQAIIFLTGSENEAESFTKDLGAYLGGLALVRFGNYQWMWYADMALAAAAALINLPIREARIALVPLAT